MVLILIGYLHMPKHKLVAYTDGACSGNPGPGGWGVLLQAFSDGRVVKERELSNGERLTTNNKMELRAAIAALEILDRTSEITIITDSKYVMNGIQTWLAGWKKNNWKNASKKPVILTIKGKVKAAPKEESAPVRNTEGSPLEKK